MDNKKNEYAISAELDNISERQVALLDQENTDGETWDYHCSGQVSMAAVFKDTLSGTVREIVDEYDIKITANEHEILSSCSCGSREGVCKHVISLLYSWVNDREDFTNVGKVVQSLDDMEKNDLVSIIERILEKDPGKVKFVKRLDDQIDEFDDSDCLN